MNIVILGSFNFPYGSASASRIRNIAGELVSNGCRVHVLSLLPSFEKSVSWSSHEGIYYKQSRPTLLNRLFRRVHSNLFHYVLSTFSFSGIERKELDKIGDIDIVLVYDFSFLKVLPFHRYCKRKKIKYVRDMVECFTPASFVGGVFNPLYYDHLLDYYYLAKKADGIIAISTYIKNHFAGYLPVIIIPAIIKIDNKPLIKEIDTEKINFTFVSSFSKRDLPELILDALKDFEGNSIFVNLLGNDGKRGYALKIRKRVEDDSKLSSLAHFWGRVSDDELHDIMFKTDFFIFLRRKDKAGLAAFPTRVPEYLNTAKPLISSDTGDMAIYLKNGENVIFIDNESGSLLKVFNDINSDTSRFTKLGKEGYDVCCKEFNRATRVQEIIYFMKSLLHN